MNAESGTTITADQVRHVAKLSRLQLTDEQIEQFRRQLGAILAYVDTLGELDTSDVEPTAHVLGLTNVLRDDAVRDSLGTQKALANAPQRDESFFAVPKVIDEGSGA